MTDLVMLLSQVAIITALATSVVVLTGLVLGWIFLGVWLARETWRGWRTS